MRSPLPTDSTLAPAPDIGCHRDIGWHGDIGCRGSCRQGDLGNVKNKPKTSHRVRNIENYGTCKGKVASLGCPALPSVLGCLGEFDGSPLSYLWDCPGGGAGPELRVPPGLGLKDRWVLGLADQLGEVTYV